MDNWQFLHWDFRGEHVLLPFIRLHSFFTFCVAAVLTISICLTERFLTYALERRRHNAFIQRSRWRAAAWRSLLYGAATLLRLAYMLIAMSFHMGLLLVMAVALATGQFFIESSACNTSAIQADHRDSIAEPLLQDQSYTLHAIGTRPRSKSKPDDIFIHPTQSNLARADAAALELGIAGSTERVHGNTYSRNESPWKTGAGREAARALLASSRKNSRGTFHLGDDSDSDDSSES
ncbi:copper transporter [Infundibulicybe gibba]|nr:copper transporter [Infundibulicybe gibba]